MIIVADTSPLTNLNAIGRIELLRQLFGDILVPPAVAEELRSSAGPRAIDVSTLPWIQVKAPSGNPPFLELTERLHRGGSRGDRPCD